VERIELHKRIRTLLRRHHLLSIAVMYNGSPWCASCFYAWDDGNNTLVITSDTTTKHGSAFLTESSVAGTIALETKRIGRIRGMQFTGVISEPHEKALERARRCYLLRFPYAVLADLHLWTISLNHIKLTDNRLGFGKKILWDIQ